MDSGDVTDKRQRAHTAIRSLAQQRGLPQQLTILSDRWNTVAELGDSGVIAKAATLAELAKSDPTHWFQQEVDVCGELARMAAPVHRPLPDQQPIAVVDGIAITLWQRVDGEMGECSEDQLVTALVDLHQHGASMELNQPWFATLTTHFSDVMPALRSREVTSEHTISLLDRRSQELLRRVEAADGPSGFIHGDAQRKNAIRTSDGAVWIDLEECSIGPYAWDLACLTMHRRFDTSRVLDRYAELSGLPRFSEDDIDLLKELRDLEGLTWMMAIQHERDGEFQAETQRLLAEVLDHISAG